MIIKIFWNQYSNGGSIIREGWDILDGNNETMAHGSCESLMSVDVELPDGYKLGKNFDDHPVITDSDGYILKLTGTYSPLKVMLFTSDSPYPIKLSIVNGNSDK